MVNSKDKMNEISFEQTLNNANNTNFTQTSQVASPNVTSPSGGSGQVFGYLEAKKHLYESGLQNIFDTYQQSIATLDKEKQKSLQDAYYVREMSKKYIGEYASNTGVGDVSGNLIDIYGQYQQNLQSINENFGELEMGLTERMQGARSEQLEKILGTQMEMLDDNAKDVLFNIETGNTNGLDDFSYIKQALDEGTITKDIYQQLYSALYTENLNKISNGLSTGYYGFKTDENGQRVPITDQQEFLNNYKGILNEEDFQMLNDQMEYFNQMSSALTTDYIDYRNPLLQDGKTPNSSYRVNFDPSILIANENVGKDSAMVSINGVDYVQVLDTVEEDMNAKYMVDNDTLFQAFKNDPQNAGVSPSNGQNIFEYNGTKYLFNPQTGAWHRMVQTQGLNKFEKEIEAQQINWTAKNKRNTSDDGAYNPNKNKADTLTYNGITYEEKTDDGFKPRVNEDTKEVTGTSKYNAKGIVSTFIKVHGDGTWKSVPENSVVYYDGMFWVYNSKGNISPMYRKTETED